MAKLYRCDGCGREVRNTVGATMNWWRLSGPGGPGDEYACCSLGCVALFAATATERDERQPKGESPLTRLMLRLGQKEA